MSNSYIPIVRRRDLYSVTLQGGVVGNSGFTTVGVVGTVTTTSTQVDITTALKGDSVQFNTTLAEVTSDASPLTAEYVVADGYSGSLTLYYTKTADPLPLLTETDSWDNFVLKRTYVTDTTTKVLTTYHVRGSLTSDGSGKGEQLITLQLGSAGILHSWS